MSRLKSQSKVSASPLLADFVQEPSNCLLLRKPGTVEMFANRHRKLILAHAILAANLVQRILPIDPVAIRGFRRGAIGAASTGLQSLLGGAIGPRPFVGFGRMGSLGCDRGRRSETNSFGKQETRVFAVESAGGGEFVGVSVGVKDLEGHLGPMHLDVVGNVSNHILYMNMRETG